MSRSKMLSKLKVTVPSEAELSSSKSLECTQKGCKSRFQTASNLNMHLVKHHKLAPALKKQLTSYACPVRDCKRNEQAVVHFKSFKLLKQHYIKCHSAKTFKCHLCPKAFAKEYLQKAHTKSCGKIFLCSCGWEYNNRGALLTHCKRKSHTPASDNDNVNGGTSSQLQGKKTEPEKLVQVCITSKMPKGGMLEATAFPTHYVAAIALSELSSTTFIIPKHCNTSVQTATASDTGKMSHARKSSQQTQTGRKVKKSAETQTSKNYKMNARKRRRSRETQTKEVIPIPPASSSKIRCEESLALLSDASEEVTLRKSPSWNELSIWNNPHGTSKSCSSSSDHSEHGLNCFDKLCNNETQTDLGDLFGAQNEGMSSAETQTTDDLTEDLYSHMCTQTTDLFDFNWVDTIDNQTQTAWPHI